MKTYMIIERYKPNKTNEIYDRFAQYGRMIPDGVEYVDSWIEENMQKCYQLMKAESEEKLMEWIDQWKDLVDFEVQPVISSEEAAQKVVE